MRKRTLIQNFTTIGTRINKNETRVTIQVNSILKFSSLVHLSNLPRNNKIKETQLNQILIKTNLKHEARTLSLTS